MSALKKTTREEQGGVHVGVNNSLSIWTVINCNDDQKTH